MECRDQPPSSSVGKGMEGTSSEVGAFVGGLVGRGVGVSVGSGVLDAVGAGESNAVGLAAGRNVADGR